ncbi:MAG: hypothetical protein RLZZ144_455 [Pseudomonadota bacterium]
MNNRSQRGVVLIEALVAILLFSIGMLAITGLQASMVKNTGQAKYRIDASNIAQQRIGMMWADPANIASYIEASPGTDISNLLPLGRRITSQSATDATQFTITITWRQPGEPQHSYTTVATIAGG